MIKFEIPYNFDPNYIATLYNCGLINDSIAYIYMPPFVEDYITVIRDEPYPMSSLTRKEYVGHIKKINIAFPGKMQLLLQKKDTLMPLETLKWYINLGFTHFCCGNVAQAKMIKELNPDLTVIGSITLHINKNDIQTNEYYRNYFDYFVLDFSYGRDLEAIKKMPSSKKYMILVNAVCHANCDGDHHWNIKSNKTPVICPGKYGVDHFNFDDTVLIRPMDLKYFEPYIDVFKIQDRSWETWEIVRDIILYTTDYSIYPGIEYTEMIYDTH